MIFLKLFVFLEKSSATFFPKLVLSLFVSVDFLIKEKSSKLNCLVTNCTEET